MSDSELNLDLGDLTDTVERLAGTARRHNLRKIRVETDSFSILIQGYGGGEPIIVTSAPASSNTDGDAEPELVHSGSDDVWLISAPMIGTFYASPTPSDPPFVKPGDVVEAGQVIAIIEAMKIMNEITSEFAGTIADVLVKNGQSVEYGQHLFRLIPAESAQD